MNIRAFVIAVVAAWLSGACTDKEPASTTKSTAPAADKAAPATKAAKQATVAGLAIPAANTATPQVLTGGQPTEEQFGQAADQGVKLVVNLRATAEEPAYANNGRLVEGLGMKYVHIPVDDATGAGMTAENAKQLAALLVPANLPAIVHCGSGQRSAAMFALKAFYADGATPEAALATGKTQGLTDPTIEQRVRDIMAKGR